MRAFARRFFNVSPIVFLLVLVLVVARAFYGYWVWQSLGGFLVTDLEDAQLRLALLGFWDNFEFISMQQSLPATMAAFAAAEQTVNDLLLSPLVLGTICVSAWLVALFGLTCELFPRAKEAGLVTVLLVGFSSILTWSSLSTAPTPLALALTTGCLWALFAWRRTHLPMVLVAAAAMFCLAILVSIDCWIFLLPIWIFAGIQSIAQRRQRSLPLVAGLILFGGTLVVLAGWFFLARLKFDDPLQQFMAPLTEAEGSLWQGFVLFLMGSPLLALALPMVVVGSTTRERGGIPVARCLLLSAIALLYSVSRRPDLAVAPQRLFFAFSFFAPLIAGGTVAAIRAVTRRPAKALVLVWIVCLVNVAFGFARGFGYQQQHGSLIEISCALDQLMEEGLIDETGTGLIERRVLQDPKASREQKTATSFAPLAQLANPSRIHMDSLTPATGVKDADFDAVAKKNAKRYRQRFYRVLISLSPLSTRLMTAREEYKLVAERGPFMFLVDADFPELADRLLTLVNNFKQPLDFVEERTRDREPGQREPNQRERPQRRQRKEKE